MGAHVLQFMKQLEGMQTLQHPLLAGTLGKLSLLATAGIITTTPKTKWYV